MPDEPDSSFSPLGKANGETVINGNDIIQTSIYDIYKPAAAINLSDLSDFDDGTD